MSGMISLACIMSTLTYFERGPTDSLTNPDGLWQGLWFILFFKIRWPIRWCKGLVLVLGEQGQGNSERLENPCCHETRILHNFELFPRPYKVC